MNERILKECHGLYTHPENGLISIAEVGGNVFLRKDIFCVPVSCKDAEVISSFNPPNKVLFLSSLISQSPCLMSNQLIEISDLAVGKHL